MRVNDIEISEVRLELKNSPKLVQEYVKALERSNQNWQAINNEAIKKIKELSKTKT